MLLCTDIKEYLHREYDMIEIEEKRIEAISPLLSEVLSNLIAHKTEVRWQSSPAALLHHISEQLDFAFLSTRNLLWGEGGYQCIKEEIKLSDVYDALSIYESEAKDYALISLSDSQYTLLETATVGAHYMLLSFIRSHYRSLLSLVTEFFYENLVEFKKGIEPDKVEIAKGIKSILDKRMGYVVRSKSACRPIAGTLKIANYANDFNDIKACLTDEAFTAAIEASGYNDTGGGWRDTYKTLTKLIDDFIGTNGKSVIKSKTKWPTIEILPS